MYYDLKLISGLLPEGKPGSGTGRRLDQLTSNLFLHTVSLADNENCSIDQSLAVAWHSV